MGNFHADLKAKAARAQLSLPPPAEYSEYALRAAALESFLRFVSEALLLFPSPRPHKKKKVLVQIAAASSSLRVGSAVSQEALGQWAGPRVLPRAEDDSFTGAPCQGASPSSSMRGRASVLVSHSSQQSQFVPLSAPSGSSGSGFPPPPPAPSSSFPDELVVLPDSGHVWQWRASSRRYVCARCLSSKRDLNAPELHSCRGHHAQLRDLCTAPDMLGHQVYLFTYASQDKFLLVCKKCGAMFDGGALQGLKDVCNKGFTSVQAKYNWERASTGRHPKAAKFGESRVLDAGILLSQAISAHSSEVP